MTREPQPKRQRPEETALDDPDLRCRIEALETRARTFIQDRDQTEILPLSKP